MIELETKPGRYGIYWDHRDPGPESRFFSKIGGGAQSARFALPLNWPHCVQF
jgi:hypothetical protein